jgi:GntR family transcriptional regulator, transcriptional repressor for pyruvate dehydrogenase complex
MERAYRRIMSELLDDIVSGEIAAAEWLPRTEDIAARHAAGPDVVREAIRALEERRVLEVHAGQGQQVLASDRWSVLDRDVAEAALLRHRDAKLLSEAIEAVRLVETQAAMLAARRVREGDLRLLEGAIADMRDSTRAADMGRRFAEADASVHRTLVLIARNRFLAATLESLQSVLALLRREAAPDRENAVVRLNERIVAALAERDATATAAAVDDYWRHHASWLRV